MKNGTAISAIMLLLTGSLHGCSGAEDRRVSGDSGAISHNAPGDSTSHGTGDTTTGQGDSWIPVGDSMTPSGDTDGLAGDASAHGDADRAGDSFYETRPFRMGFTTWPYAPNDASQTDIYERVKSQTYGDIVGIHLMDGIPWTTALGDDPHDDVIPYATELQDAVMGRITATAPASAIYLAVDPLNDGRDDLAAEWYVDAGSLERRDIREMPAPWNAYEPDSPQIISAYRNFSTYVVLAILEHYAAQGYSAPAIYFNYGSELSDLLVNNLGRFNDFLALGAAVHTAFKESAQLSAIQLLVSVALKSPKDATDGNYNEDPMEKVEDNFSPMLAFVDMIGVSTYGYIFYDGQYTGASPDIGRGDPTTMPADWLSQINTIAPGKPYAITETGWIAEDYDVTGDGNYIIRGTTAAQQAFTEMLLNESDTADMHFVIWFTLADFDPLWRLPWACGGMAGSPLAAIWRDTGLFGLTDSMQDDCSGAATIASAGRPAWDVWSAWNARTLVE